MKVTCDRGALLELLNLVGAVIVSRTPKPVLTCVKITADASLPGIVMAATDLEAAVRVSSPRVEVQEPGEALIPAEKLLQIVRESVDPTLSLEVKDDVAHIASADSHFKVYGYGAGEFPPIPEFGGEPDFEISPAEIAKLVTQTIFATARESSRYAINGVLMERDGNKLTVVATDGRRLAMAVGTCEQTSTNGDGGKHSVIVPTKALTILLRLIADEEQNVRVRIVENQIIFATEHALLASNLVEGNFPPYTDVIPRDGDRKATLGTDALASAVRRAAVLTNEESKGVRLAFSDSGLTLSSRAPEMGEAEINVELPQYSGEPIEIGFNPQFITDALKVVDTEQVSIELKAPNKPGVLRTGPEFLYVIMPVNLQ